MKTYAALISTFMSIVAVVYTMVTHTCIIEPYHIQPWSMDWIWLSIPAFCLVLYSVGLVVYAIMPNLYADITDEQADSGNTK